MKAKFSQKIECLESKVAVLEGKFKEDGKVEYLDKETEIIDTNTKKEGNIFNCDICIKEFKSKSNLQNHVRKYHMVKGKNIYKCDNCNVKYHITKEHIAFATCFNIFPTLSSLNIHITAVHDKLITKHPI